MLQTSQVMNNKMHTNSSSLSLKASTKRWTKIGANLTVKVNSCFPIFCWVSDPFQIMYMWCLLFHFFSLSALFYSFLFSFLHWLLFGSQTAESIIFSFVAKYALFLVGSSILMITCSYQYQIIWGIF